MILLSYISPEGVFNLNMVEDRFLDMKDLGDNGGRTVQVADMALEDKQEVVDMVEDRHLNEGVDMYCLNMK